MGGEEEEWRFVPNVLRLLSSGRPAISETTDHDCGHAGKWSLSRVEGLPKFRPRCKGESFSRRWAITRRGSFPFLATSGAAGTMGFWEARHVAPAAGWRSWLWKEAGLAARSLAVTALGNEITALGNEMDFLQKKKACPGENLSIALLGSLWRFQAPPFSCCVFPFFIYCGSFLFWVSCCWSFCRCRCIHVIAGPLPRLAWRRDYT